MLGLFGTEYLNFCLLDVKNPPNVIALGGKGGEIQQSDIKVMHAITPKMVKRDKNTQKGGVIVTF